MFQQSDKHSIERFRKGLSSAEEEEFIHSLFSEDESNSVFREFIQRDFSEYLEENPDENHKLSYLLERIHHRIQKNDGQQKDGVVKRISRWYSLTAAVLFIPLLIAGGILIKKRNQQQALVAEAPLTTTLIAPLGSRIHFSLPDGTKGWLNSGSSLEYNLPFNKSRQVTILGEAWFDVAHDANHPFEMAAGESKVKVMGTRFNLNAYPEDKYVEVVLEEGMVEFFTPGHSSGIEMNPNDRLILNKGAIDISVTDATKYSAWTEGKLVFRSDPMTEVVRRIERWYNVDMELVDKELEKYSFRGTFQDDSLDEVLRYLSMTSPIRYRIIDRKLQDNGVIQKKKVLIYKKEIDS